MIQLEDKYLELMKSILKARLSDNVKSYIFGSRARGDAKPYSDIDIALCQNDNQKIDFKTILELQADFNESDLPYKVDLVDTNAVDVGFKNVIEREYIFLSDVE